MLEAMCKQTEMPSVNASSFALDIVGVATYVSHASLVPLMSEAMCVGDHTNPSLF